MMEIKNDIKYLIDLGDALQEEADKHDVIHVFDDGGYRELILLGMFGLNKSPGRHGFDGIDPENDFNYELKTVNLINTKGKLRKRPGITTCHHLNHVIIDRYRHAAGFLVGVFYLNKPARVYEVSPKRLEPFLQNWELRLIQENLEHLNNPKIPFHVVVNDENILHYHDKAYDEFF